VGVVAAAEVRMCQDGLLNCVDFHNTLRWLKGREETKAVEVKNEQWGALAKDEASFETGDYI
jgi:hypothetical protein